MRYKVTNFKGWKAATEKFIKNNPVNKGNCLFEEKHLLLDLDDCLISSSYSNNRFNVQGSDGIYSRWERPGIAQFVEHLSKNYKLSVFTSSHPIYAQNVVRNLSGLSKMKYLDIFSRDHLEIVGASRYKPLDIVYKDADDQVENGKKALKNVILFDNDPFYVVDDYRFNVLVAENFKESSKENIINEGEPVLLAYLPILDHLSKCEDISATMKQLHDEWINADVIQYLEDPYKFQPAFLF